MKGPYGVHELILCFLTYDVLQRPYEEVHHAGQRDVEDGFLYAKKIEDSSRVYIHLLKNTELVNAYFRGLHHAKHEKYTRAGPTPGT